MNLDDLLAMPELGLERLVAADGRDSTIRGVVTTDMPDPGRYLSGGELVLTGLMWHSSPSDSETFVGAIATAGVAALAASDDGEVPPDLADACRRHRVPLFRVAARVAFATITESVARQLSSARASDLRSVLDRHRRLVTGNGAGIGIGPLLELVGDDLGLDCWVMTPGGRVLAASRPWSNAGSPEDLGRAFLTAGRVPHVEKGTSLFAVDGSSAPRLTDWIVAFASDWQTWPPERLVLAEELVAIVALERERAGERQSIAGRSADQLVGLLDTGAPTPESLAQMRTIGLDPDRRHVVVAAALPEDSVRPGRLRRLLHDTLPGDASVAVVGGEAIAIIPTETDLTGLMVRAVEQLGPGLVGTDVSFGVSGVVPATELRGALEEARYARRLAARRTDGVPIVGHEELASLVLLLASVPDEMRQLFRSRLLDPLTAYDDRHHSELIPTLTAFLGCNGSWTACGEELHLHVNSVRYRIQRIEDLTGRDLSSLEDRVEFFLALRMR